MQEFYVNLTGTMWYGVAALLLLTYLTTICNARRFLYLKLIACSVGGATAQAAESVVVPPPPPKARMTSNRDASRERARPNGEDRKHRESDGEYQVLMFHATWCGPCRQVKAHVLPKLGLKYSDSGKDPIYLIDSNAAPLVVRAHNITALPSYILMRRQGEAWKPVRRSSGVLSESEFRKRFPELWN